MCNLTFTGLLQTRVCGEGWFNLCRLISQYTTSVQPYSAQESKLTRARCGCLNQPSSTHTLYYNISELNMGIVLTLHIHPCTPKGHTVDEFKHCLCLYWINPPLTVNQNGSKLYLMKINNPSILYSVILGTLILDKPSWCIRELSDLS